MSQTIRLYTTDRCGDCHRAKWFLKKHQIAYEKIRIDHTLAATEFVIRANRGKRRVPTFEVDGCTFQWSPFDRDKLLTLLGL
jgi:glutaredoxin